LTFKKKCVVASGPKTRNHIPRPFCAAAVANASWGLEMVQSGSRVVQDSFYRFVFLGGFFFFFFLSPRLKKKLAITHPYAWFS